MTSLNSASASAQYLPTDGGYISGKTRAASICLVGGTRIVRHAMVDFLARHDMTVPHCLGEESLLLDALATRTCDAILLILCGSGPFSSFHRIHELLASTGHQVPLVVLAEKASRGQVYMALRIGAKAYVNLDGEPEELVKAITMAISNKVYLASDAAELLVSDISSSGPEPASNNRLPSVELSGREVEIVQLLCEGLSSKEIGRRLHISAKTVENHRYNIYRKCEVDSIAGLMRHAIHNGLVTI